MDRDLTDAERGALDVMLGLDFAGAAELRIQADAARVVGKCGCGCPTIDIVVSPEAPLAIVDSRVPVEAAVAGGGGLILFVDNGRLSGLEYWSVTDQPPTEWPSANRITLRDNHTG